MYLFNVFVHLNGQFTLLLGQFDQRIKVSTVLFFQTIDLVPQLLNDYV